jgi:hypothetical protein
MEIEYELTADDLYAFQWRAAHKSPTIRRARRNVYMLLFVAFFLMALVPAIGADGFDISRFGFVFFIVGYAVVAGLTWLFEKRGTRSTILELVGKEKPEKGQLGKHKLSLSDDGLSESTVVGEQRTSWAGVDRVEENADYIFLYTTPSAAHIVPKRAFARADDAERFYEFASQRSAAR